MLVGDAPGTVNPFTGEGIAYALEPGRIAADVLVQALGRPSAAERERVLISSPAVVADANGGYFTVGRGVVKLMNQPAVMAAAVRTGLSHPALMRFALPLLANLTDPRGDASDRVTHALTRLAPLR